jgi:hypothetical protein
MSKLAPHLFHLADRHFAHLRAAAAAEGKSMSAIVRALIDQDIVQTDPSHGNTRFTDAELEAAIRWSEAKFRRVNKAAIGVRLGVTGTAIENRLKKIKGDGN